MEEQESIVQVEVTDISRGGAGVGKGTDGIVYFVPYTAPGDWVEAKVIERNKNYVMTELKEVLRPSEQRVSPPCKYFQKCGGCTWQHISYEKQWQTKFKGSQHALKRVGVQFNEITWEEYPAKQIWEYRNRVQLRGSVEKLGFYKKGTQEIINIQECKIAHPKINVLLKEVFQEGQKSIQLGKFKKNNFKVEVEVLTNGETSVAWNKPHAALGFRQVHDEQNIQLQKIILNWLVSSSGALNNTGVLFDLFGGSGNLSEKPSQYFKQTICVDLHTESRFPTEHVRLEKFSMDTVQWLKKVKETNEFQKTDNTAIIDPPREGLKFIIKDIQNGLQKLNVQTIVLVGCDADAWARDVFRLIGNGWNLKNIASIDLFPQTPHVENLALLTR